MIDMDIEEIDDNSSQEGCPPATTATTKKRSKGKGKSKKEPQSPAVSSSSSTSTLTRFLGPAGPPSLSAWEDVNRQCPVCQQAGFSSRSLALHVNECLDVGSNAGAGAGAGTVSANDEGEAASSVQTAKKGPGTAGGRNAPTAGSARRPSNPSHAAGAGSGEGVARTPQAVPSKNKAPASNGKAAKKAKTQQDGRGNAGERQRPGDSTFTVPRDCGQAPDKARSGAHSIKSSMMDSNQSPAGVAQQQQPTPLRRRGLGLARPTRGHPTSSDVTPTPTAAAAVSRVPNGSDERVLNEIARSQLSYVLKASASTSASALQAGGWLGTQLFPKPDTGGSLTEDQCADCCCNGTDTASGQGACLAGCSASASAAGRGGKNENSRVRARPASWGARPSGGRRGWLGVWPGPGGVLDDDNVDNNGNDKVWGDGDGYVTLKPFPSVAELAIATTEDAEGASAGSGSGNGNGNRLIVQAGAAQSSTSKGQGVNSSPSPAPTSRADRFLQVFTRLQPARRALNLHESPPPSPKPKPKPKPKANGASGAEVEGAGSRSRVAAGDGDVGDRGDAGDGDRNGRLDAVSPGRTGSTAASPVVEFGEGEAKAGTGGTAGSCEVGSVDKLTTPVPKRAALRTLRLPSTGVSAAVDQRSSANIDIVPDRTRAAAAAAAAAAASAHCNSLGPSSTSSGSSVTKAKLGQRVNGPPKPPSPTPAVPPTAISTYGLGKPRGIGGLMSTPTANTKGSSKLKSLPEAAASAPPTSSSSSTSTSTSSSHLPRAMSVENVAPDVRKRPKPAFTCTQSNTPARGGGEPPPRNGSSGNSGRMIGRLTGASVTLKRASTSRDRETQKVEGEGSGTLTSTSTADAASVSGRRGAVPPRSRGALACRASSGLLRSTDSASTSASASSVEEAGVAEPKLAPAATGAFVEPSASDAWQQEQDQAQEAWQGRKADEPQKGSLTVVCDHGATLRSSWAIDDSQEVGRLVFGASLGYDAVWHLDPADEDCVGVLRYRILPHPLLAPTGGWISERGRLRDDPYTIVKATPSPTPASYSSSSSHAASSDRRHHRGTGGARTEEAPPLLGRCSPAASHHQQQQQQHHHHHHQRQQRGVLGNKGLAKSTPTQGPNTSTSTNVNMATGRESHGERASASAASAASPSTVGSGRRTQPKQLQPRSASKVFVLPGAAPSPYPGRGSFGVATSPSAKALEVEANDTGDKVTCPVCNRGMDHWKSGQRQQHVHSCLLKQPSSAKKALPLPPPAATAVVTPAPRTPGNDKRNVGAGGSGYGNRARSGVEETGPSARRQRQEGREPPGPSASASASASANDSDAADSPRPTRVSLQGVFSPKPARGQHGVGHRPSPSIPRSDHRRDRDKDRDISSRGPSASATSLRKEAVTPIPTPRSGAGVGQAMKTTGVGASRGAAQVRVQVQVPASKSTVASKAKGPAECPVCQLNFRGRLADWERQQHIQQCLESLEGVFDSEE